MKTIAITDAAEIEAIIRKCPYCTVGITDPEGNPYVVPMNFAYRDGIIYLHSGPEGGKVAMAERHPRICITFCEGHEKSHLRDYRQADTPEIIEELKQLGERAYSYHIGNLTVGIPTRNFESLMDEAAKRLEGKS